MSRWCGNKYIWVHVSACVVTGGGSPTDDCVVGCLCGLKTRIGATGSGEQLNDLFLVLFPVFPDVNRPRVKYV